MPMPNVLVFDVNETLLDPAALDPVFAEHVGDAAARREWFQQVLQSAFVSTIIGEYRDFGAIGLAALAMVGARRGVGIDESARQAVRDGMRRLPAHREVRPALERLREAGFRLPALTTSTAEVAEAQPTNAGLRDLFEQALSADAARRLKPAPEPYRMAAKRLAAPITKVRLVAAHARDVAGAPRAGRAAAFVARPGQVLDPLVPAPDVSGSDPRDVAERLLASAR